MQNCRGITISGLTLTEWSFFPGERTAVLFIPQPFTYWSCVTCNSVLLFLSRHRIPWPQTLCNGFISACNPSIMGTHKKKTQPRVYFFGYVGYINGSSSNNFVEVKIITPVLFLVDRVKRWNEY